MAVNMREKYESLSLAVLRDIAKNRGIKSTSTMRKEAVIDAMLAEDENGSCCRTHENPGDGDRKNSD